MFLAHGWTRIFSLNTNRSNVTNIFGTRMDTDGHGFYRADVIFEHESHEFHEYFLAHGYSRMNTDLPCGWWVLNTNCTNFTNLFGHTEGHGFLPCGPLDIIRTLKRRTNWSSPL